MKRYAADVGNVHNNVSKELLTQYRNRQTRAYK